MKILRHQAVIRSLYSLCSIVIVIACQHQDAGPLVPNRYGTLRDFKFPANQLSASVSVSVTASTIIVPAPTNAVYSGIATISAVAQTPAAVTKAVSDINSVLTNVGITANQVVADFTPQVVATLASAGTSPSTIQTIVSAIASNPTTQPYMPTYTRPKINGQDIGPTTTIKLPDLITTFIEPVSVSAVINNTQTKPYAYVGNDVTFKETNDVFASTVKKLDDARLDQISLVNAVYTSTQKTVDTDLPSCQATNTSKYNSFIANAIQNLNTSIGYLNAGKNRIGDAAYNTLMAFLYVQYTAQVQIYFQLQAADANACKITADAKTRYITLYRDTNLNTINDTFNKSVLQAQDLLTQIYNESSENQGSGQ